MDVFFARKDSTYSSRFDYFKVRYSDYSSELKELEELLSSGTPDELLSGLGYNSIFERIAFLKIQINLICKALAEEAETEAEEDSVPEEENLPEIEEDVMQLIITVDICMKESGLDPDEVNADLMQFTRDLLVIGASEQEIGLTLREVCSKQFYCSDKNSRKEEKAWPKKKSPYQKVSG